ncbi:G2/M phase-specific E3 ubiquitin-protein ligase, partial [Calypte anna]
VCMLCGRPESDLDVCGPMLEAHGICAHAYCLLFASSLFEHAIERGPGRWDFPIENIRRVIEEAAETHCFVCGESKATITCQESGCDNSFHLPCAVEGECITQFFPPYRAFCREHRPESAVEAAPGDTTCIICMEPVGDRQSYSTMVCPACRTAWFHRSCMQENAIHAGIVCFVCPGCRERDLFLLEMLTMGILIPLSLPSWITNDSPELEERHSRCDARQCLCPGGREQVEEEGSWQLLLCCSCAAEGTHRACSNLGDSATSWQCAGCA